MRKVISFEDFQFDRIAKILAPGYFDFIGVVYSHELTDSNRSNHTNIIDISYLGEYDKESCIAEFESYYYMQSKYPKSYPLDRNWSIEFLPHFQDPKKIAKLSHKEKVETIKKEKYELLKQIYNKETLYFAMEEMNINPLKYEPVSYILWEIRDFFEEFKELWKEKKSFRFIVIANAIIWPLFFGQLFFDVVSNSIIHFLT